MSRKAPDSAVAAMVSAVVGLGGIATDEVAEPLLTALRSDEWVVRSHAVDALARLPGPEAREAVVRALGDKSRMVRKPAMRALAGTGDPELAPVLRKAAERARLLERRTLVMRAGQLERGEGPERLRRRVRA